MQKNVSNKNIRIFQVFNSRRMNGKEIYLVRTENKIYKYFEVEKQIPWIKLVACIHADDSSDEVMFLGKVDDFKVVSEDVHGLSIEEMDNIKNNDCTIINCYRSGIGYQLKRIVLGDKFKQSIIRDYKDKYGYDIEIKGNYLSETESKVIQYMEENKIFSRNNNSYNNWGVSNSRVDMSISNLEKIYNEIKERVYSLDIESIIDSYHVRIESSHINRVGRDDDYYDYYVSECEYTDVYISNFLQNVRKSVHGNFNPHYPSSFREQQEWWANCKKMENSAKEWARKEYNKETHIYVLFAYEIRRLTFCSEIKNSYSESKKHDFELLKQYVALTWGLHDPYMSIDNNMKKKLADHNNKMPKIGAPIF